MNTSTQQSPKSCSVDVVFDRPGMTSFGGAAPMVDYFRDTAALRSSFEFFGKEKAPWAEYSSAEELETLVTAYALGIERIDHADSIERDPLLCAKLGLPKLPHKTTLSRALDRFRTEQDLVALHQINASVLSYMLEGPSARVMDLDTTVETVHGHQQGTTKGYNSRYHGRKSYQPLFAFDSDSQAVLHATLRNGFSPSAQEIIAFVKTAQQAYPEDMSVTMLRADRGFASHAFFSALEEEGIQYAIKLPMNQGVHDRMELGVHWQRIHFDGEIAIEVGTISYRAKSWNTRRRVVLVRICRYASFGQLHLLDLWDYQAIVTNLPWPAEDIWHFYNQRCTCENTIKELKYGLGLDHIGKTKFLANAADMWLKILAYNCLLGFKQQLPEKERRFTIARIQRLLLQVPGELTRHARKWTLHLPEWWPYQHLWGYV